MFLHNPIGVQHVLTQKLAFSPVSEVCFSQPSSSTSVLFFVSSTKGYKPEEVMESDHEDKK